jgi:thiol-disulfide isomerase/thioredoxin
MRLHPFLAVAFVALATSSLPAQVPIVATTGVPELNETSVSGISFAMTEADYQKEAQRLATDARFIPMRTKPAGLSAKAQFGVAFVLDEKSRSWIVDGDATKGYTFYGDFNGNGDLGDDGPRAFVDEQGKPTLRISQEGRSEEGGTHRILMKLQLDQMAKPDGSGKAFALVRYASLRRVGKVTFDPLKPPIVFRLAGPNGLFNLTWGTTSFDFDGDGTFDTEIERYVNSEKYVNVGDATYEFAADKYGNRATFTKLAVRRPDRAILKTGHAAPDFTYTDLNGRALKLSDLRGKVVLLDFWGTWCGPCVAGMPELVSLYEKYHSRGFEILGIDAKDTRDQVAAFTKAHQMPWPQTIENETDPITTRYRVDGWPTAFLVGVDGKFLEANYLGEVQLAAQLAKALPK